MLMPILFQTIYANTYCTSFQYISQSIGWVNINILVILFSLMLASIIYTIGRFFPAQQREKISGITKIEFATAVFGIILISAIFSFSIIGCSIGSQISSSFGFNNPFSFSTYYLSQMVFQQGTYLVVKIFADSFNLYAAGIILDYYSALLFSSTRSASVAFASVGLSIGKPVAALIGIYGVLLSDVFGFLAIIPMGVLFILLLIMFVIEALALNFVLPVALIIRAFAFLGNKLRDTANAFIAISIAFYFILPLTIIMDAYIMQNIDSFDVYLASSHELDFTFNSIFNQNITQLPNIFNDILGFFSFFNLKTLLTALTDPPNILYELSYLLGVFYFEGIFLIAIDFMFTLALAYGIYKGLNSIPSILGVPSGFWS